MTRGWRVLSAVAFANLVFAGLMFGLAAAGPTLRHVLDIDSSQLGVVLAAPSVGLMFGTFLWGELADRLDERRVLTLAFLGFAGLLAVAAYAASRGSRVGFELALLGAGASGSAAHSAGGRAIAAAFPRERHGFVLALRHSAIPVGGAIGGVSVSWMTRHSGLGTAVAAFAGAGLAAAMIVAWALPSSAARSADDPDPAFAPPALSPLRSGSLWLLALGCGCLAFVQLGIGSFLTIQLVDRAGMTAALAAGIYGVAQLLGAASRLLLGIASDRVRSRVGVLRAVAWTALTLLLVAIVVPRARVDGVMLLLAFVVTTSWNGVAVAAAADLAPSGRTGATLGMLTTANAAACSIAPILLGTLLDHAGWVAFAPALAVVIVGALALLLVLGRVARASAPAIEHHKL